MKVRDYYKPFTDYLRSEGMSERTISERERFLFGAIDKAIGDMNIEDLLITDTALVKERGKEQGKTGSKGAIITLRRFLKFLVQSNYKLNFYWRDIDIPSTPQKNVEALTIEEIKLIRQSITRNVYITDRPKDIHAQIRFRAMFELMIHTGMRIGEVLSLDITDVDFSREEIRITNVKTKEVETLSCVGATKYVREYLKIRKDKNRALFISLDESGHAERLCKETAKSYMRKFRKRMGFKKHLCYHIFRKTYCTLLLENGVDIKSTQYLARHKSERTTLRYYVAVSKSRAMDIGNKIMQRI